MPGVHLIFSKSEPVGNVSGSTAGCAPMRTTSVFSASHWTACSRWKQLAEKQPAYSPSLRPLSHTAVPNWALLIFSRATPRRAGARNVLRYQK